MAIFDFLKIDSVFSDIADAALDAERNLREDAGACPEACLKAADTGVRWMYSADKELVRPDDDSLAALTGSSAFCEITGSDMIRRIGGIVQTVQSIRKGAEAGQAAALQCIEDLYYFLDMLAYLYGSDRPDGAGEPWHPEQAPIAARGVDGPIHYANAAPFAVTGYDIDYAARRATRQRTYVPKPLRLSEFSTRKRYIDNMLREAGWVEGRDWRNEVQLFGMPNATGEGYADYVLYGEDGRALALIEAKKTSMDISKGRQQAKLYADILEKKNNRRPVVFLSNGFETRIDDGFYPERRVSSIYSKSDLEKLFNLHASRQTLAHVPVDGDIAGRYYQINAIKAVCEAFDRENRRRALLVMATGSGKTRTVIGLIDILLRQGWVKNILFLADRTALLTQAKRSFTNLLPNLSTVNLVEEKDKPDARCIFSTYNTMMNKIDSLRNENGRLFTAGHFDLMVCDEAHRSIYNKYKDIFNYFDAPLVGLTATPKDDIDKNTYKAFDLANGTPTYGYELDQAVKDGYLVDFVSVESHLKFLDEGIVYDQLSEEEREEYEDTFSDEEGAMPDRINPSQLNETVFNEDTIRQVLYFVMENGLKVDHGSKIGKTIIFAKNHRHAEKILEVFNKEFPRLNGFAKVIDNYINYAQSAIDEFSDRSKLPQIAISVDMLDTGIDVPEVLNLVFFKKVLSKAKFWQMIGRGTRICPGLLDGENKEKFLIFDFCGNFEFFRIHKGNTASSGISVQGFIFFLKAQLACKLQENDFQTDYLIGFRKSLVDDMVGKVKALDKESFAVRLHLDSVEIFSDEGSYRTLTYDDTMQIREHISPLVYPIDDDIDAVRFDALMFGLELAYLKGKGLGKYRKDLMDKVSAISRIANIPEIMAQSEFIDTLLHSDYLAEAGIEEFEKIRLCLRNLIKYIPLENKRYETDFEDNILNTEWKPSEISSEELEGYKAKAESYIRQNQDNPVIKKLKTNRPLNAADVNALEQILWSEVGTKEEYEEIYGRKPLGELVREIVGLDMAAAKEAFADYLENSDLDHNQIYFVNQIVEYIVRNGVMKDLAILQESPFNEKGSLSDLFTDLSLWDRLLNVIDGINANADSGAAM